MASNIYWGVVEDRDDPLCLGRCKVRIIALHSEDKTILPTSDLPWAYPLLPVISGSMSGIGISPTGILPGSWCAINFLDSAFQCPVIIGVIGGIPQGGETYTSISGNATPQPLVYNGEDSPPPNIDGTANVIASEGGSFVLPPVDKEPNYIGPLSSEDYIKLREAIAEKESGGKPNNGYSAVNTLGFVGRYQFGGALLQDLGYVRKGTTSKDLQNNECWIGKNNINSRDDFFSNPDIQDECMLSFTRTNFKLISSRAKQLRNDSDRNHCAGLLAAAHLQGPGGAIKFAKGVHVKPDAYGTSTEKYYKVGYSAIDGEMPKAMPTVDSALPIGEGISKSTVGFGDPDGVFPRRSTILESDTNRLARGEDIANTIVSEKEIERKLGVRIAGGLDTWDQPHIPYAAQYPYNNVRVSESGITEEFDNTPNAIRYHLYHPSGTYTEVDNNGTRVNRIVGDSYEILDRDGNITIRGNCNITVEGDANILSQNNVNLEVYGDCNAIVKNDFNTTVHGNMNTFVNGEYNIKANSFNVETSQGDINFLSAASIGNKCATDFDVDAQQKINLTSVESTTIVSESSLSMKSSKVFSAKSGSSIKLQSAAFTSIKATGNLDVDAAEVLMKAGTSVAAESPSSFHIVDSDLRGSVSLPATNANILLKDSSGKIVRQEHVLNDISELPPIPTRFDGMSRLYDSPDDGDTSDFIKEYENKTGESINTNAPSSSAETIEFNKDHINSILDADYSLFVNQANIATGINISENYSIRQYMAASDNITKIRSQHGFSEGEIVQNLQYLSMNITEKTKELYPEMIISSGYRYQKSGSQHEKGQAIDMQFRGTNKTKYYDIAVALSKVLPYDQLILEYKDTGTQNPWIHVSYNKNGNRGEVYTYFNHSKVSSGLKKLA